MRAPWYGVIVLSSLAGLAAPLAEQPPPGGREALMRLVGAWSGSGTILGGPATIELVWDRVLDGRFVRLTHRARLGPEPRAAVFEGHAYYEAVAAGEYRATWFDSSGQTRPITATSKGPMLVARWGTPATEEGETVYSLRDDGGLDVVDRVKGKDGLWREFGRTRLSRTLPPG